MPIQPQMKHATKDMNEAPVRPTGDDMMDILKKVRTVDANAPTKIAENLKIRDRSEDLAAFVRGAKHVLSLTRMFMSSAFLQKVAFDRQAARDYLREALTPPSTGNKSIVDNIILATARYLESNPDVAAQADFTPRQRVILANSTRCQAERQLPYATLTQQDRTCSLS